MEKSMDIKFHCVTEKNFKNHKQMVRAFLYTDYEIEPHNHDFYEMNIVFNGSGLHQIEKESFRVKIGDVFVIPPDTVHAYYDTNDLDVYHILFKKEFVLSNKDEAIRVPGFLQFMEIEPFLRQNFSRGLYLNLSNTNLAQLKQDIIFMDDENFTDECMYPLKNHTLRKILYWLSYLFDKQMNNEKNVRNGYHEPQIMQALEYIHQNYGERITIEKLCTLSYLSRSTFLRAFSEICNCTPMKYLSDYRCKKAAEMLIEGIGSKTEIAQKCGFYDLSHMKKILDKRK